MERKKVVLNGSDILDRIMIMPEFQKSFEIVESVMFDSPLCDAAGKYVYNLDAEYIIIDLYTATYELCKENEKLSNWYSKEQGTWKAGCKILRFDDIMRYDWKGKIYNFAENLKKYFASEKIILVKSKNPEYYVTNYHCRVSAGTNKEFNRSLEMIERYFSEISNCSVINLCDYFFSIYKSPGKRNGFEYEKEFYENVIIALENIIAIGRGGEVYDVPDYALIIKRYRKYYEHMEFTNLYKLLLNDNNLVDHIVLSLGKEVLEKYFDDIVMLKRNNYSSFEAIYESYEFGKCLELEKAIRCVEAIDKGEYALPNFDYSIIFSYRMRLKRTMIPAIRKKCETEKILGNIEITENNVEVCFNYLNLFLRREYRRCTELILKNTHLLINPESVDVWGSCISREIYNVNSGTIKIDKYLYRCCCLHAFEEPVDINESLLNSDEMFGSAWKKTIVKNEVYRKAEEILNNSTSKWIIIDFFDIIERCFEYKGQTFILDLFAYNGPFFKEIKDECKNFSYMNQSEALIKSRMDKLVCFLKKRYGNHIILNRHLRSNKYTTLEGEIKYFANLKFEELTCQNLFIRKWEEYFISQTNCYAIDIAKYFLGDEYAVWGVSQVHYESSFFEESIKILEEIVRNEPIHRIYNKYSYKARIERILRFIPQNRTSKILEKIFDDYYLDKILLQMDVGVIEQYREILEDIYECEYGNYIDMLENYPFEKKNSIALKEYILRNCDLML